MKAFMKRIDFRSGDWCDDCGTFGWRGSNNGTSGGGAAEEAA